MHIVVQSALLISNAMPSFSDNYRDSVLFKVEMKDLITIVFNHLYQMMEFERFNYKYQLDLY